MKMYMLSTKNIYTLAIAFVIDLIIDFIDLIP